MSSVRQIQQRREEQRRRAEAQVHDSQRHHSTDRMLAGNYASDDRVDQMRRARRQREVEQELEMEKQIEENETKREGQLLEREEYERRARELELQKRAALLDEKTRQRIREESPELRDLEQRLKVAYLNKERSIQVEEQKIIKDRERLQDYMFAKEEEAYKAHLKKMEDERQHQRAEDMKATRANLEEQIKEKEDIKRDQYDQFLREKVMIDSIVQKIYDEDQSEIADRMRRQQETREYVDNYLRDRDDWKEKERERMEEENQKISQYAAYKQARDESNAAQKRVVQNEKNRIFEKLSAEADAKRQKQLELEQMRLEMHLEAEEERQRQREKELLEKRIQQRMDILRTNENLLQVKADQDAQRKSEDDAYARQMMDKMAEMEKLDQMNAQKARLRKMEHKREVDRLMDERRQMYERSRQAQLDEHNLQEQREEARRAIIEEERQRLLQEHAVKLYGYLPKDLERELGIKPSSPTASSSRASSRGGDNRASSPSGPYDRSSSPYDRSSSPSYDRSSSPSNVQRGRSGSSGASVGVNNNNNTTTSYDARNNGSPLRSASPISSISSGRRGYR